MHPQRAQRLRSSRAFELRRLSDLAPEQVEAFAELARDADFHGLLVPVGSSSTVKSVDRQTAALLESIRDPANVPVDDDVIDLVLDGVVEVEHGHGFVSGADAFPLFFGDAPGKPPQHAIERLSREALEHAEDIVSDDPRTLTPALYMYNRIPLSPAWRARFPDRSAVLAYVGADRGSLHALLERSWVEAPPSALQGWIAWHPRGARTDVGRALSPPNWKLYISPRPERIREVFEAVIRVLAEAPVPLKIGDDAAGLLRADKFLAYFSTREELDAAANAILRALAGCDPHGVPFTAAVDAGGLLSWGIDPPDSERALSWLSRESWRYWVASRLAGAMAIAKRATAPSVPPWRFAVERVRRQGVDVDTWTPADTLWSAA